MWCYLNVQFRGQKVNCNANGISTANVPSYFIIMYVSMVRALITEYEYHKKCAQTNQFL